ncbi:MAG: NAD-dependent DNA ligase LigA [Clostridiales bacterium]|jgi:DNA ligase (NAD+)|nr:NAD-dependent DNA ligase LigA [Clostridiales bacterium]
MPEPANALTRMRELIPMLNEASRVYYSKDTQIMSDLEYDRLYDELEALEHAEGIILADSPTQRAGYTVLSSLEKVRHETPMLSLDKTKSIEKLKSFLGDQPGLLSWKLDGLTIVPQYAGGALTRAVTRGNGEIGEDVTANVRVFKNIPLKISFQGELTLRGEAVISFKDFNRINDSLPPDKQYKNPRNLCGGTVRQLNNEITADRGVYIFAFALIKADGADIGSKAKQLEWLASLGFETVEHQLVTAETVEAAVLDFEARIPLNEFASDGLVLTFDSVEYSGSLGATSKFPKDSMAFKWADEMSETTLIDIQWSTSRTGLINPVAVFEPVEIEGTTVRQASIHNVSILRDLELGIGDTIQVYKANMIIPQIADNLTRSGTAAIPEFCPVCDSPTEIVGVREGKALFCPNPLCKAQVIRGLSHFCSRDAMNIEGLSEQTLEKFVDSGFIENYSDIYNLSSYRERIINLEGFGVKSYDNLIAAIERSKSVAAPNFIYALGVNHVGLSNAKLLCGYYDNDIEKIISAPEEELNGIEGFGEVISRSVRAYFDNPGNVELLRKTAELLTFTRTPEPVGVPKPWAGLTFVITGDLARFKNRKELGAFIESMGGKVSGSVSSKTYCLINNDKLSESAKNKKALELGVRIMTEDDLLGSLPQ